MGLTTHDKSIEIIKEMRLTVEQLAEILNVHYSAIVKKKARTNYHKFNEVDFEKLKDFAKKKITEIEKIIQ